MIASINLNSRCVREKSPDLRIWLDGFAAEHRRRVLSEMLAIQWGWERLTGKHPQIGSVLALFDDEKDQEVIRDTFEVVVSKVEPSTAVVDVGRPDNRHEQSTKADVSPIHESDTEAERPQPSKIGPYRVLNTIASGGQGAVYRADHPHLHRQVAIKLSLRRLTAAQQDHVLAEGRALASLSHPNLAQVYDLDFQDGCPYLVIEYIDGRNLGDQVKQKRLEIGQAVELVAKLAEALDHIHSHGIIHQDLETSKHCRSRVGMESPKSSISVWRKWEPHTVKNRSRSPLAVPLATWRPSMRLS